MALDPLGLELQTVELPLGSGSLQVQPMLLMAEPFISCIHLLGFFRKGQLFESSLSSNLGSQGLLWAASLMPQANDAHQVVSHSFMCVSSGVRCIGGHWCLHGPLRSHFFS